MNRMLVPSLPGKQGKVVEVTPMVHWICNIQDIMNSNTCTRLLGCYLKPGRRDEVEN